MLVPCGIILWSFLNSHKKRFIFAYESFFKFKADTFSHLVFVRIIAVAEYISVQHALFTDLNRNIIEVVPIKKTEADCMLVFIKSS